MANKLNLTVRKNKLELLDYSDETTLADLLTETDSFVNSLAKTSVQCRRCGECCHRAPVLGLDIKVLAGKAGMEIKQWADANLDTPVFPDMPARDKGITELRRQAGLSELEAAVLYEYNQSEPVTFRHNERGRCFYQEGDLCGNYESRPFVCRLYLCRFGERLQDLLEMIVTQGSWHAYAVLRAVPEKAIAHNPFLKAESYGDVRLKRFEFGLEKAMGEMFSFF